MLTAHGPEPVLPAHLSRRGLGDTAEFLAAVGPGEHSVTTEAEATVLEGATDLCPTRT